MCEINSLCKSLAESAVWKKSSGNSLLIAWRLAAETREKFPSKSKFMQNWAPSCRQMCSMRRQSEGKHKEFSRAIRGIPHKTNCEGFAVYEMWLANTFVGPNAHLFQSGIYCRIRILTLCDYDRMMTQKWDSLWPGWHKACRVNEVNTNRTRKEFPCCFIPMIRMELRSSYLRLFFTIAEAPESLLQPRMGNTFLSLLRKQWK